MSDNHRQMFTVLDGHSAVLNDRCYISRELVKILHVEVNKAFEGRKRKIQ